MVFCAYWLVVVSALAVTVLAEDTEKPKSNEVGEKWLGGGFGLGGFGRFGGYRTFGGYRAFGGYQWYNSGFMNNYYPFITSYLPWANYNIYGCALLQNPGNIWFSKAAVTADKDKSRRSSVPTIEHLDRRDDSAVACENRDRQKAYFQKADCQRAAANLVEKKSGSATHGQCTLSLVGREGLMAPQNIPTHVLQKAVEDILESCAKDNNVAPHAKRSPTEVSVAKRNEIALVVTKAH